LIYLVVLVSRVEGHVSQSSAVAPSRRSMVCLRQPTPTTTEHGTQCGPSPHLAHEDDVPMGIDPEYANEVRGAWMNQKSANKKTSQRNRKSLDHTPSAGSNGIALAPPAYGIGSVDHGLSETQMSREAIIQRQADVADMGAQSEKTGLPDNLKIGIESLSGLALDHVRVHYNSPRPAQLQALAYAQGTDIHVAPGQERHLPHEAWYVVQQAQGRVKPTMQMKGEVQVNDDKGLEHEAEVMGTKTLQRNRSVYVSTGSAAQTATTVQRKLVPEKLNIAGENHLEINEQRREKEKEFGNKIFDGYWTEEKPFIINENNEDVAYFGDDPFLRALSALNEAGRILTNLQKGNLFEVKRLQEWVNELEKEVERIYEADEKAIVIELTHQLSAISTKTSQFLKAAQSQSVEFNLEDNRRRLSEELDKLHTSHTERVLRLYQGRFPGEQQITVESITKRRSDQMWASANWAAHRSIRGVWKVGDDHIVDLSKSLKAGELNEGETMVTLTNKVEFDGEFEKWLRESGSSEQHGQPNWEDDLIDISGL
jgi:hypothetical protein